jgi:uncharacterized protein (TIRG00374 family)
MKGNKGSLFLMGVILITILVFYRQIDVNSVLEILKTTQLRFLFVGIGCMFLFWLFEAYMLDMLMHKLSGRRQLWTTIKMTIVGQYYSFITPFASGGQPAQLYIMQKDKISASKATVILASKFIIFQVTVTLYSLILVMFHLKTLIMTSTQISTFVFMGLTINTVGLSVIILIALNPALLKRIAYRVIRLLVGLRIIKDENSKDEKIDRFTEEYLEGIEALKQDPLLTIYMLGLSILQLTAFFSITFFVYKGLGLSGISAFRIISLQAMLYMAVSFVPIPGTVGASEAGFALLLGSVFHGNFLGAALLLWRVITYYFGLIFSGLFSLLIYFEDRLKEVVITN